MLYINEKNCKKLFKKGSVILVAAALGGVLLTGCGPTEISTNAGANYDVIDTTSDESLERGITQIKEVPGQDFNLVIEYKCQLNEGERWVVTADKDINIEICTDGLPEGVEVYIDNVHTDTTVRSYFPTVDGIMQDTMDDHVHNSLMMGFPIADDNAYSSINHIEGQNDTFISGFVHGYQGYSNGTIEEKRFKESDYLSTGVNANKISSVIDLIIVEGEQVTCTSVKSEVQVSVWPFVQKISSDGTIRYAYYTYNAKTGKMEEKSLTEEEYLLQTEVYNQRKIKEK